MKIDLIALVLSVVAITFTGIRWVVDSRRDKKKQRLDFLVTLTNGFSSHNWRFIEHWDFPGVWPCIKEFGEAKTDDKKELAGQRITTVEQLNILFRIFTQRDLLTEDDILGFASWAQSWYPASIPALKITFTSGDLYPLDFIVWLRDTIFRGLPFAETIIGTELRARLRKYEAKKS